MVYWYEIEQKLPPYKSQIDKCRMAYKIRMVTFVGMMLSLSKFLNNFFIFVFRFSWKKETKFEVH